MLDWTFVWNHKSYKIKQRAKWFITGWYYIHKILVLRQLIEKRSEKYRTIQFTFVYLQKEYDSLLHSLL